MADLLKKQRDIAKKTLDLLTTIDEALRHIRELLNEGNFKGSIPLFEDVVHGFSVIEGSIDQLEWGTVSEAASGLRERILNGLDLTVDAYEEDLEGKVREILQFTLIPLFAEWQKQLDLDFAKALAN